MFRVLGFVGQHTLASKWKFGPPADRLCAGLFDLKPQMKKFDFDGALGPHDPQ